MHGRVKVRTSEEQAEAKKKEQQEKLKIYSSVTSKIFIKRKNDELDEELLELTRGILEKNPDFYTFWNYRRETLLRMKDQKDDEELKKLSLLELDLTQHCLKVNPKSYSTWNHRFWVMEFNPDADWKRELKLCNFFLSQDERNFHCWDYRRLVAKKCLISPEEELEYTSKLIESNFSNYSAWHYRSKLLPIIHLDTVTGSIKENVLLKEFELIQNAAFTDPDDQSVWFYHRWLLGKNSILQILNVSVFKPEKSILVLLSEPLQVNSQNLKLYVNDTTVHTCWRSVSQNMPVSSVWLCDFPLDPVDTISSVTVKLSERDIEDSLSCSLDGILSSTWKKSSRRDIFRSTLNAAAKDVLEQELESCQQLNDLEPDNKWTVFTCVLLMRALNDSKFDDQIVDFMNKLMKIDALRKNYYKDLGSKFVIENMIESLPVDVRSIDLSKNHLTSLHHFDHFLLIEHIDLSSNNLTSIYPFQYLVYLKSAILDDNQLTTFHGVENLKHLKSLSVQRNCIKEPKNLNILKTCSSLEELFLQDNPLFLEADYNKTLCIFQNNGQFHFNVNFN
ncbi:geranylgeranyl transferase type-2 subunit alpha isoform X2 [Parasteatoda tepidariorum]|uniref:geranylgeranyl transferase type-2 subunit alpha isoform X2 n=1 Tax=Parasteatoda tepidariorum TaxID=114398 RepID=UPI00077FC73F|nr:geranylgeranyl transferase type-2 subunit alpha isoform X2 [Parasteatoda tepidariorum]